MSSAQEYSRPAPIVVELDSLNQDIVIRRADGVILGVLLAAPHNAQPDVTPEWCARSTVPEGERLRLADLPTGSAVRLNDGEDPSNLQTVMARMEKVR